MATLGRAKLTGPIGLSGMVWLALLDSGGDGRDEIGPRRDLLAAGRAAAAQLGPSISVGGSVESGPRRWWRHIRVVTVATGAAVQNPDSSRRTCAFQNPRLSQLDSQDILC